MAIPPNLKMQLRLYILCALVACLWVFSSNANSTIIKSQGARQFERSMPVVTDQLQQDNGVIPVELRCENAELSAPNALEKLSCVIRNNTNKYIAAATINISLRTEKEGKETLDSSYLTIETFGHPDFRQEHQDNLIPPGGEFPFQDAPTSYDNIVIKGVTVRIDYIEFADSATRLGLNRAGSRIIANIREGAEKYKNWLVKKYNESGKSINAIAPLLEKDQPIPAELDIQNGDQQQGVIFYRNYALKTFKIKGADELSKRLNQPRTATPR
jgi:hypothetical protein